MPIDTFRIAEAASTAATGAATTWHLFTASVAGFFGGVAISIGLADPPPENPNLSDEAFRKAMEAAQQANAEHQEKMEAGKGKGGGRDRGTTGKPSGTDNPFKKMIPDPDDPSKVIYRDPSTGKTFKKPKPEGFDDYWKEKHPPKPQKPPEPQKP